MKIYSPTDLREHRGYRCRLFLLSCSDSLSQLVDVSLPYRLKCLNECKQTNRAWKEPMYYY